MLQLVVARRALRLRPPLPLLGSVPTTRPPLAIQWPACASVRIVMNASTTSNRESNAAATSTTQIAEILSRVDALARKVHSTATAANMFSVEGTQGSSISAPSSSSLQSEIAALIDSYSTSSVRVVVFGATTSNHTRILDMLLKGSAGHVEDLLSNAEDPSYARVIRYGPSFTDIKNADTLTRTIQLPSIFLKTQNIELIDLPPFDYFSQMPMSFTHLLDTADLLIHVTEKKRALSTPLDKQLVTIYSSRPYLILVNEKDTKDKQNGQVDIAKVATEKLNLPFVPVTQRFVGLSLHPRTISTDIADQAIVAEDGSEKRKELWQHSGFAQLIRLFVDELSNPNTRRGLKIGSIVWAYEKKSQQLRSDILHDQAVLTEARREFDHIHRFRAHRQSQIVQHIGSYILGDLHLSLKKLSSKTLAGVLFGTRGGQKTKSINQDGLSHQSEYDPTVNLAMQSFWWTSEQKTMYEIGAVAEASRQIRSESLNEYWSWLLRLNDKLISKDNMAREILQEIRKRLEVLKKTDAENVSQVNASVEAMSKAIDRSRVKFGVLEDSWLSKRKAILVIVQSLGIALSGTGVSGSLLALGYSGTVVTASAILASLAPILWLQMAWRMNRWTVLWSGGRMISELEHQLRLFERNCAKDSFAPIEKADDDIKLISRQLDRDFQAALAECKDVSEAIHILETRLKSDMD